MKTNVVIGLVVTFLAFLALVGYLIVTNHDPTPVLVAIPGVVVGLTALFGINKVDKQTNGANAALRADAAAKAVEISHLRSVLSPEQAAQIPVTPPVLTVDTPPVSS